MLHSLYSRECFIFASDQAIGCDKRQVRWAQALDKEMLRCSFLMLCLHETRLREVNAFHNSKMERSTIEMLIDLR